MSAKIRILSVFSSTAKLFSSRQSKMSTTLSRPPTPLSELPTRLEDERFIDTGAPCEWAEEYRPSRFHPLHFGDTLDSGRYRVIRKLGYGSFSTVWLAVNAKAPPKYVAVKVLMAKNSLPASPCPEIDIARTLATSTGTGSGHILKLLDTFQQEGPNGVHTCLVYEAMAGTVASLVTTFPGNFPVPGEVFDYRPARYEKWMGKRILKHTLLGLEFLHQNNVVHSDLQPGNLLFSPRSLDDVSEADLTQSTEDKTTVPLQRLDGKEDKWGPRYLALGQSLDKYANLEENMCIKISDLGAAFFKDKPPSKIVTPVGLRSPETILGRPVDEKIDIWSFGCLFFELMTGTRLFPVDDFGTRDEIDDDHFLALNDILGELPEDIATGWTRRQLWFGPKGERLNPYAPKPTGEAGSKPDDETSTSTQERQDDGVEVEDQDLKSEAIPMDLELPPPCPSLEQLFDEHKPDTIDEDEARIITDLIRRILRYNPAERPSAADLLAEKWFQDA